MRKLSLVIVMLAVFAAAGGRLLADEQRAVEAGRKLLKSSASALLGVNAIAKLQIKATGGGGGSTEQEVKIDCTSLVIDPSGLSVTSLTNLNPQNMLPRMRGRGRGGEPIDLSIESELRGIKLRMPDGSEITARVVLKDDDLDLAFVAPSEPLSEANKRQIAVVKLEAVKVDVLDTIIELGRTSKEFNYAPAVQLAHISAVLTRPRTSYLGATTGLGTPIFNDQGRLIGLVTRFVSGDKEAGEGSGTATRGGQAAAVRVVLPAGDIARLVDQAKEAAKKPAPKDD
jgi:hypothetical protein